MATPKTFDVVKKWYYHTTNELWLLEEPDIVAWYSNLEEFDSISINAKSVETSQYFSYHMRADTFKYINEEIKPYWIRGDKKIVAQEHKCNCPLDNIMLNGCQCGGE